MRGALSDLAEGRASEKTVATAGQQFRLQQQEGGRGHLVSQFCAPEQKSSGCQRERGPSASVIRYPPKDRDIGLPPPGPTSSVSLAHLVAQS